MRSTLGRLGVLVAVVVGLAGSGMAPAHASTLGTALFQGDAFTGPLGYPCTPVGTTTNCLAITNKSGQPTVGFVLGSYACTGQKTDVKFSGKGVGTYGPLCHIQAQGTITGYCGFMLGTLQVRIIWFSPLAAAAKTVTGTATFKAVNGTAEVIGTSNKGTITGTWEFTPDPTRGSCLQGTQTGFIVTGSVTLAGLNNFQ